MSDDLHVLAGLYALDALDEVEARRFERHLDECDACRTEVAEFRDAAQRVGTIDATEAPPAAMRARVLADVAATPQVRLGGGERRARRGPFVGGLLGAAAAVFVVAGLGVALVSTRNDLSESRSMAAALSDPDAEVVTYQGDDGVVARLVGVPGSDQLVVVLGDLPPIDSDRAYAMWMIGPDGPVPMGLMRPDGSGHAVAMIEGDLDDYTDFGITNEPAGGSLQPTGPIIVTGVVPTA